MSVNAIIIISVFVILTICISILYSLFHNETSKLSFKRLYPSQRYNMVVSESSAVGKGNSPFLDDDELMETLQRGGQIISKIGNIYEGVTDYDNKPRW